MRLGRRAHGEGELAAKMARAGYAPDEIDETLSFLRERRYLDDAAFALGVAHARAERRRWGPARIEQHLRRLKLSEADIRAALDEVFAEGEDRAARRALEAFVARDRRKERPADVRRARAYRHLLSRGFAPEVAHELVTAADFEDTGGLESP